MLSSVSPAWTIAVNNLKACYFTSGILAGRHHFTDYWARDGFFAAFGSLFIGDQEIVEKMVELFFRFQRSDGLIPYRIRNSQITPGRYFGFYLKPFPYPKPSYRLREVGAEVLDGTTLTLLFLAELGLRNWRKSHDFIPSAEKALHYLQSREKYGLLWDGDMAEWIDSVKKSGNLLYTNVIYWQAIARTADWLTSISPEKSTQFRSKAESIARTLKQRLWNGKFFADWHDGRRRDYFYPFSNLLAIAWGLTSPRESKLILNEAEKSKIGFTLETNTPAYPWRRVWWLSRLAGMADYQNSGLLWWQPGLAYILALTKMGKRKEAEKLFENMAEKVINDNGFYECYEKNGKPVKRFFYQAEYPFAWAAGMFLWVAYLSEFS